MVTIFSGQGRGKTPLWQIILWPVAAQDKLWTEWESAEALPAAGPML